MADRTRAKRTFVVSGCASGIGKHMAIALAREGQRLVLIDLDAQGLERMACEHGLPDRQDVLLRAHDVRDFAGWQRIVAETIERFGAIDVMLNIAGCLKPGFVEALSQDEIDRQVDVNVKGVMYATRAAAEPMIRQGHGHIVNVASLAGISHVPGLSVYCASKHAVRGFSLSVAHELSRHGVQVSVVCPDAVETPMLQRQTAYEEAAMTFGAGRGLTLEEMEAALRSVLDERPLERIVPVPRTQRGALAKLCNAFPALGKLGVDKVRKQGEKVRAARLRAS